jgi:protein-S-isoprenylcysteine O-methyltransferase Ste14
MSVRSAFTASQLIRRRLVQLVGQVVLFGLLLFVAAGTLNWWNAWLYLGLFVVLAAANGVYLLHRNPEVVAERGRTHQGTKQFDRILMSLYSLCYLLLCVVAGLDRGHLHWAELSWTWALLGAVLMVASMVPVAAAMGVNRSLETTVRIQLERDHQVVSSGPYRIVRHPMYVGMLMQVPATALVLGSSLAMLPALVCVVLVVVRTALEDRMLQAELPGYADFALVTRFRLIPGLW